MWRDTAHTDKTEQDAKNKCDTSGVLSTAFVLEASAFPHTDLKKKKSYDSSQWKYGKYWGAVVVCLGTSSFLTIFRKIGLEMPSSILGMT